MEDNFTTHLFTIEKTSIQRIKINTEDLNNPINVADLIYIKEHSTQKQQNAYFFQEHMERLPR